MPKKHRTAKKKSTIRSGTQDDEGKKGQGLKVERSEVVRGIQSGS